MEKRESETSSLDEFAINGDLPAMSLNNLFLRWPVQVPSAEFIFVLACDSQTSDLAFTGRLGETNVSRVAYEQRQLSAEPGIIIWIEQAAPSP